MNDQDNIAINPLAALGPGYLTYAEAKALVDSGVIAVLQEMLEKAREEMNAKAKLTDDPEIWAFNNHYQTLSIVSAIRLVGSAKPEEVTIEGPYIRPPPPGHLCVRNNFLLEHIEETLFQFAGYFPETTAKYKFDPTALVGGQPKNLSSPALSITLAPSAALVTDKLYVLTTRDYEEEANKLPVPDGEEAVPFAVEEELIGSIYIITIGLEHQDAIADKLSDFDFPAHVIRHPDGKVFYEIDANLMPDLQARFDVIHVPDYQTGIESYRRDALAKIGLVENRAGRQPE